MSRQARVGVLVITSAIVFFLGLFAIGNRTFLFSNTMEVKAQFSRVAGLVSGAAVQYQGVDVGRVQTVELPTGPNEKIVVTMAIAEKAHHLIRQNTQAQIKGDGLVGEQIVVLVPVAEAAAQVEPGGFMVGIDPFDLFEITDKALASVQGFERAASSFEQIMVDVRQGEGTLGKFVYDPTLYNEVVATTNETRRVLTSLSDNTQAQTAVLVDLATQATVGLQSILTKIDTGEGTMAKMLNDPAVYNSLLATADTLQSITGDLRAITSQVENTSNWGVLGAYRFAELMEAAKHNWLFKRYFEERGNIEQAQFEVRELAIEETYKELNARQRELLEWEERLKALEATLKAAGSN